MATGQQVLDLPMNDEDSGATTVRGYLGALLRSFWREQEGFSGKRPFGNSGWTYDLYKPLVEAGFVPGSIDSDGYIEDVDTAAAHRMIRSAIDALIGAES